MQLPKLHVFYRSILCVSRRKRTSATLLDWAHVAHILFANLGLFVCLFANIGYSFDSFLRITSILSGPPPPFEAILVIFGRSSFIFFLFESSWKNENDTTFVRMRSGYHRGDAKKSKKAPRSVELNYFTSCAGQKRFSQNERSRADLQSFASIFLFLPQDLVMIFQSLVIIFPRFFDFEIP